MKSLQVTIMKLACLMVCRYFFFVCYQTSQGRVCSGMLPLSHWTGVYLYVYVLSDIGRSQLTNARVVHWLISTVEWRLSARWSSLRDSVLLPMEASFLSLEKSRSISPKIRWLEFLFHFLSLGCTTRRHVSVIKVTDSQPGCAVLD